MVHLVSPWKHVYHTKWLTCYMLGIVEHLRIYFIIMMLESTSLLSLCRLSLKLYYMCQCGFYLYSIAALLVWETRRKDFAVMMSHHVITVILIGYSYIARYLFLLSFANQKPRFWATFLVGKFVEFVTCAYRDKYFPDQGICHHFFPFQEFAWLLHLSSHKILSRVHGCLEEQLVIT